MECSPTAAGDLNFHDLFYSTAPADPNSSPIRQPARTATDRIILKLSASILRDDGVGLLSAFYGVDSAVAKELYSHAAQSSKAEVRSFGLAGLISSNDYAGLTQLEEDVRRGAVRADNLDLLLSLEQLYESPDPAGVQALGRIAAAKDLPGAFRTGAAHALMRIHAKEAAPILAALLDDASPEIRFRPEVAAAVRSSGPR